MFSSTSSMSVRAMAQSRHPSRRHRRQIPSTTASSRMAKGLRRNPEQIIVGRERIASEHRHHRRRHKPIRGDAAYRLQTWQAPQVVQQAHLSHQNPFTFIFISFDCSRLCGDCLVACYCHTKQQAASRTLQAIFRETIASHGVALRC